MPPKMSPKYLNETLALWSSSLSYDEVKKKEAHRRAKRLLNMLALMIGLSPDKFTVHSNLAGPAVSGEVTLHSDPLRDGATGIYVQIGQSSLFSGSGSILFRICKNRADYVGGLNNWLPINRIFDFKTLEEFAYQCRKMMRC